MIVHFERIGNEWLPISVAILLSAVITLAATAGIMVGCNRLLAKPNQSKP